MWTLHNGHYAKEFPSTASRRRSQSVRPMGRGDTTSCFEAEPAPQSLFILFHTSFIDCLNSGELLWGWNTAARTVWQHPPVVSITHYTTLETINVIYCNFFFTIIIQIQSSVFTSLPCILSLLFTVPSEALAVALGSNKLLLDSTRGGAEQKDSLYMGNLFLLVSVSIPTSPIPPKSGTTWGKPVRRDLRQMINLDESGIMHVKLAARNSLLNQLLVKVCRSGVCIPACPMRVLPLSGARIHF